MNIGLIGSGGREHALCKKLHESKLCKKIFCFPGNGGTENLAKNIEVNILNFNKLLRLIKLHKIKSHPFVKERIHLNSGFKIGEAKNYPNQK